MRMDIKHGFWKTEFTDAEETPCHDELCVRIVSYGEICFRDMVNDGVVYCRECGQCARYERKCAENSNGEQRIIKGLPLEEQQL